MFIVYNISVCSKRRICLHRRYIICCQIWIAVLFAVYFYSCLRCSQNIQNKSTYIQPINDYQCDVEFVLHYECVNTNFTHLSLEQNSIKHYHTYFCGFHEFHICIVSKLIYVSMTNTRKNCSFFSTYIFVYSYKM